MAAFKKIIKNTTGADIEIREAGRLIPALGQIEVDPIRYLYWSTPETITELTPLLNAGDIVINDGTNDLTAAEALRFLEYPDRVTIKDSGTKVAGIVKTINIAGGLSAVDDGDGQVTLQTGGGAIEGRTFQVLFFSNGNTANKWLFHLPTSDATDQLPYYNWWNVEVFGISFSNKNANINCDIEFYINGTNNPAKIYTLQVRDSKFAHQTTLTSLFTADIGDLISCYIRKVGNSTPSSVEVDMGLRIRDNTVGSGSSN